MSPPTIVNPTTVQVTNVKDNSDGSTNGVAGVTGVVFYVGSIGYKNGAFTTVSATNQGNGIWTANLPATDPTTLHAVAVDGSGNFTDCAAGNALCYGVLYHIQNGYNNWSGGYLDVSGVVPGGFLDWVNPRDPGGNLFSASTASINTRDGLSGTWTIMSAATPAKIGPVQYNDLIYLQNQYPLLWWMQTYQASVTPPNPDVRGGYLDVRGAVGAWDPGPGNLFRVSTATSNQRDGLSGTWQILSAATPAKTGPVQVGDTIYLQNQYPYTPPPGVALPPNVLGGYLETRGAVVASDPGGGLLRVLTATSDQFDQSSGTWRFTHVTVRVSHRQADAQGRSSQVSRRYASRPLPIRGRHRRKALETQVDAARLRYLSDDEESLTVMAASSP
jgi:hypothetical protein